MNQGCCAAAHGRTPRCTVVRPFATSAAGRHQASTSVSAWSASPRALPLTLNSLIPQHSGVFKPWLLACSSCQLLLAPQMPGVCCISPLAAHAHFASLAQPHPGPVRIGICHQSGGKNQYTHQASTVVHLAGDWRQGLRPGSAPPPAPLPGRRRQGLGPWWRVSP
jgi:hypothetical protein